MKRLRWVCVLCAAVLLLPTMRLARPQQLDVSEAFDRFWSAGSPEEAEKRIGPILQSGLTFDEAWRRLKAGRAYKTQKAGVVMLNNQTKDGVSHYFAVNVPAGYDPAKAYQLRFQLHGGVSGRATNQPRGSGEIGQLAGPAEQFYVLPYSWSEAPWWSDDQVLNLNAIIDQLKRTYNIDENRVVLSGVSDGGTGAYYFAMRDTTPFASFLPLNGFLLVLASGGIDDGHMFPNNMINKPLFAVNGGMDPLYPTEIVDPVVEHLVKGGVDLTYHPQPNAAHNTSWWPTMRDSFEAFVANHPRDPHPERLTWETDTPAYSRAHWLVIDELGGTANDSRMLDDLNFVPDLDQSAVASQPLEMFYRRKQPGRVNLTRSGNTVEATTHGVAAFTLLLSPEVFDFSKPIKVTVNGKVTHDRKVERSVETLLKWAARDNDRTMLYGAELKIRVQQ